MKKFRQILIEGHFTKYLISAFQYFDGIQKQGVWNWHSQEDPKETW